MIDFELMTHQKEAIYHASIERDVFLAWDMGTGKSCAAIQFLRERSAEECRLRRTLILAPKVVLSNWKDELKKFSKIDASSVFVLTGPVAKRAAFFRSMVGYSAVIVINYDALQNEDLIKAIQEWDPEILIADESHSVKNYKSKRAKNVARIADGCIHRYLLTGTPILNNAMDLFMQYRILDGYLGKKATFGHNFFAFRAMYFMDRNAGWNAKPGHFPDWVPRPGAYEELMAKIAKKTLRVDKKDCLDLPPLVKQKINVELGPEQKRLYKEMKDNFITYIGDHAVVAQMAMTKALRLQQIVSGFVKTDEGITKRIDKVPRLEALKEQLEIITKNHKVIVWACFKENYNMIREVCDGLGIKSVELHGGVREKDRREAVTLFNDDPSVRVLIGNQGAGGIGINLVSASYAIYYSRSFKLGDDLQSEARNYRRGSEIHKSITRIDLIANETLDELIAEALQLKVDLSDKFLDYIKEKGAKYGFEQLG